MRLVIQIFLVIIYYPAISQEADSSSISFKLNRKLGCGVIKSFSKINNPKKKGNISFICYVSNNSSQSNHLYVVDGKKIAMNQKNLIPHTDEIETINVLNPDKAMAIYGSQGMEGALLIFTKKFTLKIIVMDIDSKQPIPKATISVSFLDKKPSMFSTNEAGEIIINPIDKEKIKEVAVSATGYFPVILDFTHKETITIEMNLLKDYKELTNVTVSSGGIRSTYCGSTSSIQFTIGKPLLKVIESTNLDVETFPNPVNRNQTLQIKYRAGIKGIIQLFSGTGNLMFSQKINSRTNLIQVPISPSYSPGAYFLRLVDENNQVGASKKIIIQ